MYQLDEKKTDEFVNLALDLINTVQLIGFQEHGPVFQAFKLAAIQFGAEVQKQKPPDGIWGSPLATKT